ncbi:NAD-dependent epimerase/dehydratase family protein [Gammaproteobacteria bacterium]|nr:NAD-dependent epimerase/dehydratase family protein [Gammaproteobacteria bacterium]
MKIKSLLVGASGLVGSEILKNLNSRDQDITLFTRSPLEHISENTNEISIDFDEINNLNFPALDHVYIAIGMRLTTFELIHIKNNKRKEFFEVDHDLVYNIAKKAFHVGARSIAIVSAVGADMNSNNFYLQTKGKMENSIKEIGYEKIVYAQPSHLLGSRSNQKVTIEVPIIELGAKILDPLMRGPLSDLRFVKASAVAKKMVETMNESSTSHSILKFKDFLN